MSNYRVQFEVFEGPLDLLLHLVRKEEVDIYQINLTKIANEFIAHLEQMRELDLDVAGEFLVMAATLIYIKSRELLPREQRVQPVEGDDDEADPRWDLIRRLVEYKKFKDAAATFQAREQQMDAVYEHRTAPQALTPPDPLRRPDVTLFDLIGAVSSILKRYGDRTDIREIEADPFTVSERIETLRSWITERTRLRFSELFQSARNRAEVVVTFLAMLELIRMKFLHAVQSEEFGDIDLLVGAAPGATVSENPADIPPGTASDAAPPTATVPNDPASPTPNGPEAHP